MNIYVYVSALIFALCHLEITKGDLSQVLAHFDILKHKDINHKIVRRSIDNGQTIHERRLQFNTLGRQFHLNLRQKEGLLSPDFRLYTIDHEEKETQIPFMLDNFYQGYIYDEPWTSEVHAFFDEDGTLTATIKTPEDTYNVEPSWRHNITSIDATPAMIAYKSSDLKMDKDFGESYCGFVREGHDEAEYHFPDKEESQGQRSKRQTAEAQTSSQPVWQVPTYNTCPLMLVADYRFFDIMGQKSISKTTNYLINLIDRVDRYYRTTNFSYGFTGMGFEIKEIKVHEYPTVVASGKTHYNMETDYWETRELLETFSRDARYKKYCLAHLFTHQKFDGGVLGLAYIGSPRTYSVGGICSPAYYKGHYELYLNTGWSSSLNRYDRRLLTSEAELVTTHEFGHNWGSEHDPDTAECSPGAKEGGKHIMYTYSVSGLETNNKLFSPCSKRSIGNVLQSKSSSCFKAKSQSFCGNSHVEGDEECDIGLGGKADACCTAECKLTVGAKCSDANDICCKNCDFVSSNVRCHEAKNTSCEVDSYCTGDSATCPQPKHKPDDEPCIERGKCRDGQCLSFCESEGKISCACDNKEHPEHWCKWCCRDNENSACEAYHVPINLPEGVPCVHGFCNKQGECERQVQDLVERFWDIIENISPSDLVQFMRANIVGTIIVLSLVIWIPASCLVSYIDRKRRREEEDEQEWHSAENKALYEPEYLYNQNTTLMDPEWERPTLSIRRSAGLRSRSALRVQIPSTDSMPNQNLYTTQQPFTTYI